MQPRGFMVRSIRSYGNTFNGFMSAACFALSKLLMCAMALSVSYNVAMRYLFNRPTVWAEELNAIFILAITALGAAEVMRNRSHIAFTLFSRNFSDRTNRIFETIRLVVGLAWCAVVTCKSYAFAVRSIKYGMRESSPLLTPMVIPYGLLTFGMAVLGLQFAALIFNNLCGQDQLDEKDT